MPPSINARMKSIRPEHYALAGIVLAAIALRFAALGAKSYWEDEGLTIGLIHRGYGSMLHNLRISQPDPPLYFSIAWVWVRVFGYGQVALRSISAIAGVLTIPIAYLVARRLVGVRSALIATALLAVNPFLIWYSQEARPYALFALLATVSIWFLLRALERPALSTLIPWGIVIVAMLATHYFAVFLAVLEAAWLMRRTYTRERRRWFIAILALAGVAVIVALTASLGGPARKANWGGLVTLPKRVVTVPSMFLVGFEAPDIQVLALIAAIPAAFAVISFVRGDDWRRPGVILAGSLAVGGLSLALLASLAGEDYLVPRNLIFTLVPGWIVLGAAFGSSWDRMASRGLAALLGALGVAIVVSTASTPKYHYQDWRRVAAAMGARHGERAVVLSPPLGAAALSFYIHQKLRPLKKTATASVSEIDVIAIRNRNSFELGDPAAPRAKPEPVPPGFQLVSTYHRHSFTLVRYIAAQPQSVSRLVASLAAFTHESALTLVERGRY